MKLLTIVLLSFSFAYGQSCKETAVQRSTESRTAALGSFGNVTIDYFVGRLKFAVAPPADRIIYVWGEYHLPVAFVSDWHKAKVDFTTTTALSVTVEEALPAEIGCSPTEAFNKA